MQIFYIFSLVVLVLSVKGQSNLSKEEIDFLIKQEFIGWYSTIENYNKNIEQIEQKIAQKTEDLLNPNMNDGANFLNSNERKNLTDIMSSGWTLNQENRFEASQDQASLLSIIQDKIELKSLIDEKEGLEKRFQRLVDERRAEFNV